jgi:hypothetical protein
LPGAYEQRLKAAHVIKSDSTILNEVVDLWKRTRMQAWEAECSRSGFSDEQIATYRRGEDEIITDMADLARKALPFLQCCNDGMSPEELETIARDLSPGGAHDGGWLINLIKRTGVIVDPLLLAAVYMYNWHGGKVGFQFMPDIRHCPLLDYLEMGAGLLDTIISGTGADPCKILTGDDRPFFDSLPDRFFVYRGCPGLSAELAAAGICWTINKPTAQWFANRGFPNHSPMLVGAWVNKVDVALAKAVEFEVVVQPRSFRKLKCEGRADAPKPEPSAFQPGMRPAH